MRCLTRLLCVSALLVSVAFAESLSETRKKAEQGDALAQNRLGNMYQSGEKPLPDPIPLKIQFPINNTIGGINGLYRRSAFLAAGGFDEALTYWEDMDLALRLFARGLRCSVVNEELVTAYRRAASYSNSNLGEVWRVKLAIMRRLLAAADPELKATIAREAETIATRLAMLDCWPDVPAALALATDAGGNPPTTSDPAMRLLKKFLPRPWTFRLQHLHRARAGR